MRTQVRKIGNSLGNIIPAAFIKQLGLVEGSDIEVKADGNKITMNFKVQAAPVMATIQQQQPYAMGAPVRGPQGSAVGPYLCL